MKRQHLIFILTAYVVILVASAWPVTATHMIVSRIQGGAAQVMRKLSILPGLPLFYRPYNETNKIAGWCMRVRGYTASGESMKLMEVPENCQWGRGFQWHADIYATMFIRFMEETALERIKGAEKIGERAFSPEHPPTLREKYLYNMMGDFFCRSSLVARPRDVSEIAIAFRQDKIAYATGQRYEPYQMLMKWDCAKGETVSVRWRPFLPEENMQRFLDGKIW